jgi:hypothetical protein
LAASLLSSDFSYRTFRTQAIVRPSRSSLLSGKLAAIAVYLLAGAVVAVLAASLTALVTAPVSAHTHGWYTIHALADAIVTIGGLWLALASYASVGVAAALLIRSPGPATLVGVIYVTGIDGYLTSALQHVSHGIRSWLPQPSIISLTEGTSGHAAQALSVAVIFAVILLTVAFTSFVKRDIA